MRTARTLAVLAIVLAGAGCGLRDPLERNVSVPTLNRFATWRSHVASDYNPELARRIENALQEIRLNIAGERELQRQLGEKVAGGTEAIDEAVRQRVDGRPLREVLQLGSELRVRRLKEELAGLENAMNRNARLVTRPGDLDSKHHLEGLRDRQTIRVEKYRADLAATERDLEPLKAKTRRTLIDTSTTQLPVRSQTMQRVP